MLHAFGYATGRMSEADIPHGNVALAIRAGAESLLAFICANADLTETLRENRGLGRTVEARTQRTLDMRIHIIH